MAAPEVVVVLGCRTLSDGSPKPMMIARVKKGVEVYNTLSQDGSAVLILTGFQAPENIITEAKAMQKLAEEMGVPNEAIYPEEKAARTEGNAFHSRLIIDQLKADHVHVVTSNYHLKRAQVIFEKVFPSPAYQMKFHGSEDSVSEEEMEQRMKSEELLFHSIDHNLKYLAYHHHPDEKPLCILESAIIPDDLFTHGFTTRFGGVSTFPTLSSLNLFYNPKRKDPQMNIDENRMRVASQYNFSKDDFVFPACVHGCDVYVVGKEKPDSFDAIVTNKPHHTLVAPSGDCVQLLFCDPVKKVIGSAHSGWRGTLARVGREVVKSMKSEFECNEGDIHVAVGPAIGPCCFEVGDDVAERFAKEISEDVVIRKEGTEKATIDLWKSCRLILEEAGVLPDNIDDSKRISHCTVCDEDKRFFSYRRDGAQFGTQIAFICLKADEKKTEVVEETEEEKCLIL